MKEPAAAAKKVPAREMLRREYVRRGDNYPSGGRASCEFRREPRASAGLALARGSRRNGGCLITAAARRCAALAGGRTAQAAVGHGPLHGGTDEHGGVVDPAGTAGAGAAAVDLIAVVLVIGDPVHVVEGAIVTFQGVIIVM